MLPSTPTLTPAEQAILDLVTERGPMVRNDLALAARERIGWKPTPEFIEKVMRTGMDSIDDLLSRGLLLERERTVECSTCGGPGTVTGTGGEGRVCPSCSAEGDKWGTGSVKERVIGTPCSFGPIKPEHHGKHDCPVCSPTPTPGLDPGSESETTDTEG